MSRERFREIVEDLRRLDPTRIRVLVHMQIATLEGRNTFDAQTATLAHAALVDEAARVMVRQELLASYRDRVSGIRPLARAVARIELVKRQA